MEEAPQAAREPRLKGGRVAERRESQRLVARERRAREPTQQPHHVARAVRGVDPLEVLARSRGDDARHGQVRRVTLQVAQRRDLKVHGALAFSGRGDLEHVARAVRGMHSVILVALAVERRELALDAPVLAREVREPSERKPGGIEVEVRGAERLQWHSKSSSPTGPQKSGHLPLCRQNSARPASRISSLNRGSARAPE